MRPFTATMNMTRSFLLFLTIVCTQVSAQSPVGPSDGFRLGLPTHNGQISWTASGYKVIQSSVKPNGNEIGVRARDDSSGVTFLGLLFRFPEQAPLTSEKCRDGVMGPAAKENSTLRIEKNRDLDTKPIPVAVIDYTAKDDHHKIWYSVRAFAASEDICADLEFYSENPIHSDDPSLSKILSTYRLDMGHSPTFADEFIYAQMLYNEHLYKQAAPMFSLALQILPASTQGTADIRKRVLIDEMGMAYGISGDIPKARSIFEKAVADDPDYPLYYYNLACADAEENNLTQAKKHLQAAFARKNNVNPGEQMPNPLEDDSFLPYKSDKAFWTFLQTLTKSN